MYNILVLMDVSPCSREEKRYLNFLKNTFISKYTEPMKHESFLHLSQTVHKSGSCQMFQFLLLKSLTEFIMDCFRILFQVSPSVTMYLLSAYFNK